MARASEVLEAMVKLRPPGPTWSSEAKMLIGMEDELRTLGIKFLGRQISSCGYPELVLDSVPNV